jgi:hypothetical protein
MSLMRTLLLSCLVVVLLSGGCTRVVPAEAPVDLFNGKDLSGWKAFLSDPQVRMEEVWSVKDGVLVCKGEPLGYLYTEQSFTTDFQLIVEWRWAPGTQPGNSGVLLRINGEPRPIPRSIEAQLRSGSAGDLYGFHGMKIDGDPARTRVTPNHELLGNMIGVTKTEANEKEPGEWNRYEITVKGSDITVLVNGKQVNEARDSDVLSGPIGLQSEGGEIHFRTVQLIPLS